MSTSHPLQAVVRRSLALAIVAGAGLATAYAQEPAAALNADSAQPFAFQTPTQAFALHTSQDDLFSSSLSSGDASEAAGQAATTNLASLEKNFHLPGANAQYGRRRYGAPRYRGGNTNPDGSEKYDAFVGGGVGLPLGNSHKYTTASWGFQAGAGRNFNKNFGLNVQFDFDHFGLQGSNLTQQSFVEDPLNEFGLQGATDGYSHIWSLTLDPIYNIKSGEGVGAYVTGGVGFYHKITTFTTPEQITGYDYYGYPETFVANEPFDSYTSNSPGVNGGFGLTYKFSRFANERFYAEVRYVVTFNSQRQGINGSNYNQYADTVPPYSYPTTNLYPANSNRSTYIPVKFGIRF